MSSHESYHSVPELILPCLNKDKEEEEEEFNQLVVLGEKCLHFDIWYMVYNMVTPSNLTPKSIFTTGSSQ